MKRLKVCFIGVGSIAKRHIRNLQTVCTERGIDLQMDAVRRAESQSTIDNISSVYSGVEQLPDDYDAIFITNPTDLHLETLMTYHTKGKNFFIEKIIVLIFIFVVVSSPDIFIVTNIIFVVIIIVLPHVSIVFRIPHFLC